MAKIIWITDYPDGATSGYATITKPICNGLVELGHEVKVIAMSNKGEEHWEKFSIIPVQQFDEGIAAIHNLNILWKPDIVVCAVDIPILESLYEKIYKEGIKFVALTPMENGPLMQSWAMGLSQYDKILFISKLAEDEAHKIGLPNAEHLVIGIDTDIWSQPTETERKKAKETLGFEQDEKIVLTVADNHERKNLWAGLAMFAGMLRSNPELHAKYVIVTRDKSPYGWRLNELASSLGIGDKLVIFARGIPQNQLRLLYVIADAFLLTSKAEGLGLPILEAMAVGVPCVATNTGALTELLADGRGYLIPSDCSFIDVWGNSKRDMASIEAGSKLLYTAINNEISPNVRPYILGRNWENTVSQFNRVIKELVK